MAGNHRHHDKKSNRGSAAGDRPSQALPVLTATKQSRSSEMLLAEIDCSYWGQKLRDPADKEGLRKESDVAVKGMTGSGRAEADNVMMHRRVPR